MYKIRCTLPLLLALVLCVGLWTAFAQKNVLQIDYSVTLSDIPNQQFHISTDIKNINQPRLDLSLPTWTPGWYTVENYYKNVLRFQITELNGKRLPPTMILKQTWRVDTTEINA